MDSMDRMDRNGQNGRSQGATKTKKADPGGADDVGDGRTYASPYYIPQFRAFVKSEKVCKGEHMPCVEDIGHW